MSDLDQKIICMIESCEELLAERGFECSRPDKPDFAYLNFLISALCGVEAEKMAKNMLAKRK